VTVLPRQATIEVGIKLFKGALYCICGNNFNLPDGKADSCGDSQGGGGLVKWQAKSVALLEDHYSTNLSKCFLPSPDGSMNGNEMSRVNITQDQQSKVPFHLSEHNQGQPSGFLFLDDNTLVLEFQENFPEVRIKQAKARSSVEFIGDSSLRIELPDSPGKKIRLHLSSDGEGRFAVYGIREWTGIDGTEPRAMRKQRYLARFESTFAKLVALWQLVLPCTLLGVAYLMQSFVVNSAPEADRFATGWLWLAFTPIVAVHFAILLIPAIAILFYSRIWGLRAMFLTSLLLILIVTSYGFFPDGWQFMPTLESSNPLILPDYWLVFVPYMVLLFVPTLYYITVIPRM